MHVIPAFAGEPWGRRVRHGGGRKGTSASAPSLRYPVPCGPERFVRRRMAKCDRGIYRDGWQLGSLVAAHLPRA